MGEVNREVRYGHRGVRGLQVEDDVLALWHQCDSGDSSESAIALGKLYEHANRGNPNAMLTLANVHVRQGDHLGALAWFKKAADIGDDFAMVKIGSCYRFGKGGEADLSAGAIWYWKAADLGNPFARIWLRALRRF
jgi:TPR repeat protein